MTDLHGPEAFFRRAKVNKTIPYPWVNTTIGEDGVEFGADVVHKLLTFDGSIDPKNWPSHLYGTLPANWGQVQADTNMTTFDLTVV